MTADEEGSMLPALIAGALIVAGVAAITVVYHRQWHVRLLRQIRALPERHHRDRTRR